MKKALLLAAVLICFSSFGNKIFAQGNLEFNQVRFFDLISGTAQTFTVPAGKVWKIESAGAGSSGCNVYLQNSAAVTMSYLYVSSASSTQSPYPIWLPSGFTGGFIYWAGCAPYHGMVSVIEFNVVP